MQLSLGLSNGKGICLKVNATMATAMLYSLAMTVYRTNTRVFTRKHVSPNEASSQTNEWQRSNPWVCLLAEDGDTKIGTKVDSPFFQNNPWCGSNTYTNMLEKVSPEIKITKPKTGYHAFLILEPCMSLTHNVAKKSCWPMKNGHEMSLSSELVSFQLLFSWHFWQQFLFLSRRISQVSS